MKTSSKWFPLPMAAVLAGTMLLSACGSSSSSGSDGKEAPTEISMNLITYADELIDNTNPLWAELEKRTNTKLKIDWITANTFDDKINVLLASGNLPDLTFVESMTAAPVGSQIQKMIQQGVFWDLTPYLKDYPNLSSPELKETFESDRVNGKNYSIPRYYPSFGGGVFPILRQDWLDKLGLQMPTTLDEFYNVLKTFKEKDPAGNGQTIPYAASPDYIGFILNIFNDTQGAFKLKDDGKLYPIITEDATRDAVLWIKKAYEEGLFPPDFAILNFSQINEFYQSGKAGGGGYAMNNAWSRIEPIHKIDPNAVLMPVTTLAGPSGKPYSPSGLPFYGDFLIPKTVSEEKVKKILAFFDYGYSPEGNKLAKYGVEGLHYTESGGVVTPTEQAKKDLGQINVVDNISPKIDKYGAIQAQGMPEDLLKKLETIVDERSKVRVPRPDEILTSDAYNKYYGEMKKKASDMRVKAILGKISMDEYDKFIMDLRNDQQLQLLTKEMNESYQANMKK